MKTVVPGGVRWSDRRTDKHLEVAVNGQRLWRVAARQVAVVVLATAGLLVATVAPAHALYRLNQSFETLDAGWYWGLEGQGSGEWYTDRCDLARTGCGGVLLGHAPTGWVTLYTTVHLSALDYGWCSFGYYAQRRNSTGPATARLEILKPDGTYLALTDRTLTNTSWTYVGAGFYQFAARDVKIRITLPGSGTSTNPNVGMNVDDLEVYCRVLVQGRG
jgi:hypothetical protein